MPLTADERALCETIEGRADAMLAELAEHVAIPTGRNHRPGLERYRALVVGRLVAMGAEITERPSDARPAWMNLPGAEPSDTVPSVVVARRPGAAGGPRVLVAGHLDTVHDPDGDFRELTPVGDDVNVTGPGAVDMKGGIVIALNALEVTTAAGVAPDWSMLLNSDEETGSMGSASVLRAEARQHDVGLALEPALADGSLAIERMGSGTFKVEVFGRSAHVGRAFTDGVSAVTALGELLGRIASMADPTNGLIVSVGPLVGGEVTNAVPEYAACWGNARFADAAAGERLGGMLDALATDEAAMPRVDVHRVWNRPAKPATEEVERLGAEARRAAEALGQSLPFASTGGVCDGNILQDVGLPTLDTLGVRGGNLHRLDEFVEVDSLVERCQLLAVLLTRLGAGRGT